MAARPWMRPARGFRPGAHGRTDAGDGRLPATAAIRKLDDPKKAAIPIIAMTAHAMKGEKSDVWRRAWTTTSPRPIDHRKLFEIIHRLCRQLPRRPPRREPRPATASSEGVFHLDRAVTILDGRYELFQEMVAYFFRDSPEMLNTLHASVQNRATPTPCRARPIASRARCFTWGATAPRRRPAGSKTWAIAAI